MLVLLLTLYECTGGNLLLSIHTPRLLRLRAQPNLLVCVPRYTVIR